jgi:hypothetical protein
LQGQPNWPSTYRFLAACYAHMGRINEASGMIQRLKELTPVVAPEVSQWRKEEDREFYLTGLRLAAGDQSSRA